MDKRFSIELNAEECERLMYIIAEDYGMSEPGEERGCFLCGYEDLFKRLYDNVLTKFDNVEDIEYWNEGILRKMPVVNRDW